MRQIHHWDCGLLVLCKYGTWRTVRVGAYHDQNDGVGPGAVDVFDHVHVGMIKVSAWDLVGMSVVVSAHLDDDQVGGLLG